jgi:hypothetical protein
MISSWLKLLCLSSWYSFILNYELSGQDYCFANVVEQSSGRMIGCIIFQLFLCCSLMKYCAQCCIQLIPVSLVATPASRVSKYDGRSGKTLTLLTCLIFAIFYTVIIPIARCSLQAIHNHNRNCHVHSRSILSIWCKGVSENLP